CRTLKLSDGIDARPFDLTLGGDRGPSPQLVDERGKAAERLGEGLRIDAGAAGQRVDWLIGAVEQEDVAVAEIGTQPQPDARVRPLRVDVLPRLRGRYALGYALLELAQHLGAPLGDD